MLCAPVSGRLWRSSEECSRLCLLISDLDRRGVRLPPEACSLLGAYLAPLPCFVAGCRDGGVRVVGGHCVPPGGVTRTVALQGGSVNAIACLPDGKTMAVACQDGGVRMVDIDHGAVSNKITFWNGFMTSISLAQHGRAFVAGTRWGVCLLNAIQHTQGEVVFEGCQVTSVAYAPRRDSFAAACHWCGRPRPTRASVRIFDGRMDFYIQTHQVILPCREAWSVAFAPCGRTLSVGCGDGSIYDIFSATGQLARVVSLDHGPVWSVTYAPFGGALAAACGCGHVHVLEPLVSDPPGSPESQGPACQEIATGAAQICSLAYDSEGLTLAAGCHDGCIRILRLPRGPVIRTIDLHGGPVHSVACRPQPETGAEAS